MFAIDRDNGIRAYAGAGQDATPLAVGEMPIIDFEEFVKLSQLRNWSKEDITEVWNSFAGTPEFSNLKPQKQFKNRQYGLEKIWAAIQRLLEPEHAPDATQPAAESENPTPKTMKPKKTPKPKADKPRKTAAKAEKKPRAPRTGTSKKSQALELLKRKSGATIEEITERLGWNKNSCIMLIQWVSMVSKAGISSLTVEKNGKGERVYKAA